jgi:hypothetical protein
MDSFNLNSDAYTEREIEELFNLKKEYNTKDVSIAKTVLIKQLNRTQDLGVEKQREIMFFIDTISNRILNKINLPQDNTLITQGTNFIIENPDRIAGKQSDFTNGRITVDSNEAPPGYINPINVRTITQAISFDTRFRPNYYTTKSTNFDMVLPAIQKNVINMRVATLELPLTYYAVSQTQGNATCLIINLDPTKSPQECWVLNLPDGNYEQSWADRSRAEHIELAMNIAINTAQYANIDSNGVVIPASGVPVQLSNAIDLVYSLNRTSGRSIFSVPSNSSIFDTYGFTIRFNVDNKGSLNMDTSIQLRLGWQLGFRSAEYICNSRSNISPPNGPACVSEGICLVSGPRYGFLSIDDYQKNTGPAYMVAYGNSILQNNIITRINLAALKAQVGIYQSSSDAGLTSQVNRTREYFGPVDIQRLHVSLYDEFGRIIDLNNMDWSFSLTFEILYN